MSKVEKELQGLTDVTKEAGEKKSDYLKRIFTAVTAMDTADWEALSLGAKTWYNDSADKWDADEELPSISAKYDNMRDDINEDDLTPITEDEEIDTEMPVEMLKEAIMGETDSEHLSEMDTTDTDDVVNNLDFRHEAPPTGKIEKLKKDPVIKTKKDRKVAYKIDKYGLKVGSKSSTALTLFERGATMAEAKRLTGGTHYNVLRKLAVEGHKVYQEADGRFFVRHKTEFGKTQEEINETSATHVSS